MIFAGKLLRVLLVVEHGGQLWLCPRRPGGWASRTRLTMTDAARSERLRPARDIEPSTLGIPAETGPQDAPGRTRTGNHDFHAQRHTYISGIVAGGKASVKTCQELARHSTLA
jgi:hypothetical protein